MVWDGEGGFSGGARGDWQPWKAISRLTLHGAHSGATCRGPFVAQLHGEKKFNLKKVIYNSSLANINPKLYYRINLNGVIWKI